MLFRQHSRYLPLGGGDGRRRLDFSGRCSKAWCSKGKPVVPESVFPDDVSTVGSSLVVLVFFFFLPDG